jgi:hypothetical protein
MEPHRQGPGVDRRRRRPTTRGFVGVEPNPKEFAVGTILLIILILLLIGAFPTWGYSRKWGYGPSGVLGLILVIVLILLLLGYLPRGF